VHGARPSASRIELRALRVRVARFTRSDARLAEPHVLELPDRPAICTAESIAVGTSPHEAGAKGDGLLLLDIADLEPGAEVRASVCIVGAGAAGITLARTLASRGVEVALLESGGLDPEPEIQALHGGEASGAAYPPLHAMRLRYLGGTTNHWEGQSALLDPEDFALRAWVPDSGWPIPYREYLRYLDEARAVCELGSGSFDYSEVARQRTLAPFPPLAGLEPVVLRFSPPTRFGRRYRAELESHARIRCVLHATCLRLAASENGGPVVRADAGSLDGRRIRVVADRYVLAAGAIENARLLLLSTRPSGVALGNDHGLVGRYFMEHPYVELRYTVLSDDRTNAYFVEPSVGDGADRLRRDARLVPDARASMRILNHSFYFARLRQMPPNVTLGDRLVRLWDKARDKLFRDEGPPNHFVLRLRLEHAPHADSRVVLADDEDAFGLRRARVEFRFGELERRTIVAVQERVALALGEAGLGRVRLDVDEDARGWIERIGWQWHHMGGTRMHEDPRRGVVDANARVHGTSNLYVAGSSIFPTSGHANPTLSLVALTLRLADRLGTEARGATA